MNTPDLQPIVSTLGNNKGGFMHIDYCPVNWLAAEIVPDIERMKVVEALQLIPGKSMLRLTCQAESITYTEKPKNGAAGPFVELLATCVVNLDDAEKSLMLNALRGYRLVVVLPDKNNRTRIMGTKAAGAVLSYEMAVEPEVAGKSFYTVSFSLSAEAAAPFYEPV